MRIFGISAKAREDLLEISAYTTSVWGKGQAEKYLEELNAAFHLLVEQPYLGAGCDGIAAGLRRIRQGRHIIFYRIASSEEIRIVRVLHRHRLPRKEQFNA